MSMKLQLVSIDPWQPAIDVALSRFPAVIGCQATADVQIEKRWADGQWCQITEVGGTLRATVRNDVVAGKVSEGAPQPIKLSDGDQLSIGIRTFRVTIRRQRSTRAKRVPAASA